MKNCDALNSIVLETPMKSGILFATELLRPANPHLWLHFSISNTHGFRVLVRAFSQSKSAVGAAGILLPRTTFLRGGWTVCGTTQR